MNFTHLEVSAYLRIPPGELADAVRTGEIIGAWSDGDLYIKSPLTYVRDYFRASS